MLWIHRGKGKAGQAVKPEEGYPDEIKKRKKTYIAVASVIVIVVAAAAILSFVPQKDGATITNIGKAGCEASGGTWNECGSPCTGAPQGTVCIQVCRQQCEWYSSKAELARNNPGVSCAEQGNGILMCWLPAETTV